MPTVENSSSSVKNQNQNSRELTDRDRLLLLIGMRKTLRLRLEQGIELNAGGLIFKTALLSHALQLDEVSDAA